MNLGQWEGKAGNYLETEDTGIPRWADLTQYWGSWALWGAGWVRRAGWRRAGQWGQPGHHVPEEWTEFKCPKLEAALESWGSSWGSGDHCFAATSTTNTSALLRRPSEHPHCQNRPG